MKLINSLSAKDFIKVLQIATKQGLIEEVKKNGRVCYKAKLK